MRRLPRAFISSACAAQVVAAIGLGVYRVPATMLALVLLMVALEIAKHGKIWAIGASLAVATSFPAAMAAESSWSFFAHSTWVVVALFSSIGVAGAVPFAVATPAMARFDRGATLLLAIIALVIGTVAAIGYHVLIFAIRTR